MKKKKKKMEITKEEFQKIAAKVTTDILNKDGLSERFKPILLAASMLTVLELQKNLFKGE